MTAPFQVSVAKESLGFSAAHFLAIEGHLCERLHGHNYRLSVTVEGRLDPATGFLIDFAVLKRVLRELVDRMDHRVLIPARNPALAIHEEGDRVRVDYAWPGWLVVPRSHACVLPVAHTTAEVLAEYLAGEVWQSLEREHAGGLSRLELEVEESAGQAARYAVRPGDR